MFVIYSSVNRRLTRLSRLTLIAVLWAASSAIHAAVVFSALHEGMWKLYYQASPDLPPQPVVTRSIAGDKGAPRLSPEGKRVAFEVTGGGTYVCPIAGEEECRAISVGRGFAVRPAWNPRTGELAFVHYVFKADEEQSTIKTADDGLSKIRPLVEQTGIQDFPDISSDGRRLVYTSWQTVMPYRGAVSVVQQVWTLDLARGKAGQLLLSNSSDIHPRWSPDGAKLAFSSNRTGRYEIWTASTDGGDLCQVTHGVGDKTWPAWSPDGSRILFTHSREGRTGLSLVDLESGAITAYTPFKTDTGIQLKDADWHSVSD